ncbi:Formin_homology 2 domain-containing protein [Hexamita inflata]|uniref:Formin homology 2 domain-containing protein n=1 Tax=Hexamita inflata TaxID=28002 RepID=A0AA86P9W6_9EUKA|nr:Formin homology 2 domain-containing protein [Hexamita inflata]
MCILYDNFAQKQKDVSEQKVVKETKVQLISVIDSKKAQAISIALQKLKLPFEQIMDKILLMQDLTPLDPGIETLACCLPTQADIDAVKKKLETEPDVEKYARADQFVIFVQQIKNYSQRIQNWLYIKQFQLDLQVYKQTFQINYRYFTFLIQNKRWHGYLRMLLTVGNCFNSGTARGSALGFKLKTLLKFCDFKDTTIQQNLMYYILNFIKHNDPRAVEEYNTYLEQLNNDVFIPEKSYNSINPVYPAIDEFLILQKLISRTAFEDEKKQFDIFYNKYNTIKQTIDQIDNSNIDQYKVEVTEFISLTENQLIQVKQTRDKIEDLYKQFLSKYVEPQTSKIEETLEIFGQFSVQLEKTKSIFDDEEKKKQIEEEKRRKLEQKKQEEIEKIKTQEVKGVSNLRKKFIKETEADGLMDQIMGQMIKKAKK